MPDGPIIPKDIDRRDITTFKEIAEQLSTLSNILNELRIKIPEKSDFEDIWLNAVEMENIRLGKTQFDFSKDIRPKQRKVLGLLDLTGRIIRVHARQQTIRLKDHLKIMTECQFAQNIRTITEEKSNKVFELLIGLVCSELGTDLIMDSPYSAKGDNPDVLLTIDKRRWGLACKVMNGYSALTMFERIEEGINQIEKSEADIGCVVINLKNVINHEEFWPLLRIDTNGDSFYGVWRDYRLMAAQLLNYAADTHFRLEEDNTKAKIEEIFKNKKAIPGVLLFLQTAGTVMINSLPVSTSIGVLNVMKFGEIHTNDLSILQKINEVLHLRYATS